MKTNMTLLENQLREQAELLRVENASDLSKRVVHQIESSAIPASATVSNTPWLSALLSNLFNSRNTLIGATAVIAMAVIISISLSTQTPSPVAQKIVKLTNNLENKLDFSVDQLVAQREIGLENELEKIEADIHKISSVVSINALVLLK